MKCCKQRSLTLEKKTKKNEFSHENQIDFDDLKIYELFKSLSKLQWISFFLFIGKMLFTKFKIKIRGLMKFWYFPFL